MLFFVKKQTKVRNNVDKKVKLSYNITKDLLEVKTMLWKIDSTTNFLKKALDGTWYRNKVISQNIANVDTPKYKRKSVVFEDYLKQELSSNKGLELTNNKHIPGIGTFKDYEPKVVEDKSSSYRFDGNNVNIDVETGNLAKNTIMHEALIKQLIDEYDKVKNAIIEGGK